MKLVSKHIERDGSVSLLALNLSPVQANAKGYVVLRPEDDEDMWHVYNLIAEVRYACLGTGMKR